MTHIRPPMTICKINSVIQLFLLLLYLSTKHKLTFWLTLSTRITTSTTLDHHHTSHLRLHLLFPGDSISSSTVSRFIIQYPPFQRSSSRSPGGPNSYPAGPVRDSFTSTLPSINFLIWFSLQRVLCTWVRQLPKNMTIKVLLQACPH